MTKTDDSIRLYLKMQIVFLLVWAIHQTPGNIIGYVTYRVTFE